MQNKIKTFFETHKKTHTSMKERLKRWARTHARTPPTHTHTEQVYWMGQWEQQWNDFARWKVALIDRSALEFWILTLRLWRQLLERNYFPIVCWFSGRVTWNNKDSFVLVVTVVVVVVVIVVMIRLCRASCPESVKTCMCVTGSYVRGRGHRKTRTQRFNLLFVCFIA